MKPNTELENLVLMTLSFFEPMTFSQVILDLDSDLLKIFPEFDKEQLQEIINFLEKKKLIKKVLIIKETGWIRIHPKRAWWKLVFFNN